MAGDAYALIMAGGGGTRLWPASRRKRPKQFLPLLPGGRTLLGATVERLLQVMPAARVLVVTAAGQVDDVKRCAPELPAGNIVVEPEARNTAACIGLGAVEILRRDPEGRVAVVPSDQYARDPAGYRAAVEAALEAARHDVVVTVGIKPTRPETGFGYVEAGEPKHGAREVARFVEKPDRATAETYLRSGRHLWNSGMFFFRAARMLSAIDAHMPELGRILKQIQADPAQAGALYPKAPKNSIDYGVMEKLGRGEVLVVEGDFGWSDVGAWTALPEVVPADPAGNVALGEHLTVDASGNVLYAEGKRLIAALGVQDLVIVVTDEAVLVLPKSRAQDVKAITAALETTKRDTYL